jgi:hypothetical protein
VAAAKGDAHWYMVQVSDTTMLIKAENAGYKKIYTAKTQSTNLNSSIDQNY